MAEGGREELHREQAGGMRPADELIASAADEVAAELDGSLEAREAACALDEPRFGLLGRKLAHSWSPRIHALLGSSPYALFEREPEEVEGFLRRGAWRGLNVTIPYKRRAFELADDASEACSRLGAANTLTKDEDGAIYAENTDVFGFSWMLERFCERHAGAGAEESLAGGKALVLGSGGASEAVRLVLGDAGMRVVIVSRKGPEGYDTLLERHADAALIVNATPVGMYPACPESPLRAGVLEGFPKLEGVLDVVYNPLRTRLVLDAERLGVPSEGGLAMLVAQAFASSERFQGKALDAHLEEQVLGKLLKELRTIYFIGMPGAGKTGAARRLAHALGRPFVDLDDSFEMAHDQTAAEFIREHGEAAFRAAETKLLAAIAKGCGLVVACGGGVVVRPENLELLRQNGYVIFLNRPLEELSLADRPISQARGVEALAAERMDSYLGWSDLELPCTGSAEGDALLVKELLDL